MYVNHHTSSISMQCCVFLWYFNLSNTAERHLSITSAKIVWVWQHFTYNFVLFVGGLCIPPRNSALLVWQHDGAHGWCCVIIFFFRYFFFVTAIVCMHAASICSQFYNDLNVFVLYWAILDWFNRIGAIYLFFLFCQLSCT